MFQVEHPPAPPLQQQQRQPEGVAMAMGAMSQPATPPPRKWVKQWLPQDTILNSGKLTLLKWVTEDMVTKFTGVPAATEEQDAEENEILYLCTFEGCGKGFTDAGGLRKHAHTHGEKQFICHYEGCGKRFVDSSKLKRHFLIHTGEKHFVCPFEGCGKAFSLDFNLRSHMRTHTGENYHACPYEDCGKRYAHEYKLRAHMRNHHDKNIPEMSPPPMHMERDRERDQELEMGRYRDTDQEREREVERERENVVIPRAKSGPPRQDLNAHDRPFACPHPGCTKRYIHEYKLNLHLRNSHADENLEYEESPVGRGDSDGEDDVDEGSIQGNPARGSAARGSAARGSGRGKLKIIPKRETVEPKRKKGNRKVQKEVDLSLRMRLPSEPNYWGGGQVKQTGPARDDSEETEEDDAENTEDEGYKYYQGRGRERGMADDEDTEDDGDQY